MFVLYIILGLSSGWQFLVEEYGSKKIITGKKYWFTRVYMGENFRIGHTTITTNIYGMSISHGILKSIFIFKPIFLPWTQIQRIKSSNHTLTTFSIKKCPKHNFSIPNKTFKAILKSNHAPKNL
jgi:hypothetical protein